jgi:DmsE family decaheme c-type cytochrome
VESDAKRGWQGLACEACHGPGAKHAASANAAEIMNPAKLPAPEADRDCLKCHLNQPTHVGRIQSSHAKDGVACTACHSIHKGPEKLRPVNKTGINQLCASCHVSIWAQFQRPYHHKLPEGAMSCVDCHNPHGSFLPGMMQSVAANEPGCFRCHGDKRGPFTYEHPPVKTEGCRACHEPHGSANPRMLTRHEVRLVCLECHANIIAGTKIGGVPPAFHDLRNPRYQNCTICHTKIHGSYVSSVLER